MKPLSTKQKDFFYRELVFGNLRFIAKPIYDFCVGSILLWERGLDLFSVKDSSDISSLTIVIKTFERDKSLKRLLASIRRRYPSVEIIVVNDSKVANKFNGEVFSKLHN